MTDKEIIEALKENRYTVFSGWLVVMQEKANDIGKAEFEFLHRQESRGFVPCSNYADFRYSYVYRLRADYEEKPEIVECEVYVSEKGYLHYRKTGHKPLLSKAIDHPDFIGFKYEGSELARPTPRRYRDLEDGHVYDFWHEGYEVLTPTHVLFQVTK